jgi:hypothetical protein
VLESEEETALFEFVHVWLEKLLDHLWGGGVHALGGEGAGGRLRACPLLPTCAKLSSRCVSECGASVRLFNCRQVQQSCNRAVPETQNNAEQA